MQAPEWVRERLDNWGRWMAERGQAGLGYPRSNILVAHGGRAASADHVPVDSVAAGHTHRAVQLMRVDAANLWMAIQCRYVGSPMERASRRRPMVYSEIGVLLNVTESTARTWVLQAELQVADTLDRWCQRPAIG